MTGDEIKEATMVYPQLCDYKKWRKLKRLLIKTEIKQFALCQTFKVVKTKCAENCLKTYEYVSYKKVVLL